MSREFAMVTGAAGFIGSRLTQVLLDNGRNVLAIDCFLGNLYSSKVKIDRWGNLNSSQNGKLEKIEFDLRDDNFSIFDKFNIVSIYNLAAMPGLVADWGAFAPYYECNISALNRLLEYSRSLPLRSFIHASTSSVYGTCAIGDEKTTLRPSSPYGVSKLAAEGLLNAYVDSYKVPGKILRYFSVYGPHQRPDMAYAKIIEAIKKDSVFTIFGTGEQKRSNTFIDDVVEATILAESRAEVGEILNICGDESVSLNQAIALIESHASKKLLRRYQDGRKGDQVETKGANAAAKKKLGWNSRTTLSEGLKYQVEAALSA